MTKPKVVLLIAFTALVGMLLSRDGLVPWQLLLFGLLGISLAAACGAVINHIIDQRIDAVMDRTSWRPIPSGHMDTPHHIRFALALGCTFVYQAIRLLHSEGRDRAMKTFAFSILYLSLLFTLLLADHYLNLYMSSGGTA
jgi:heme O synthase-like polyprenyltransferase